MPLLQSQTLIFSHLNWHHNLCVFCLFSKLVSALVWILPQPASEHPEHGGEHPGSSRPGAVAAPGGPRHHITGNSRYTRNVTILKWSHSDNTSVMSPRYEIYCYKNAWLENDLTWLDLETTAVSVLSTIERWALQYVRKRYHWWVIGL